MTTSDPAAKLTACRNTALQAIEDDDWNRVIKECMKAEMILDTIPDSRIGNISDLEWNREGIRQLRKRAEELQAQGDGCGLNICNVEYQGVREGSCGCSD